MVSERNLARAALHREFAHREIALTYRCKKTSMWNIRQGEVRRVVRFKLGPDASKAEIDAVISRLGNYLTDSPDNLGKLLSLTFQEKHGLGIRTIACCDRTRNEVSAWYRAARQDRQNLRRRILRERKKAERKVTAELHPRARAIFWRLNDTLKSAATLSAEVANSDAFLDRGMRPLDPASRRQAVHRVLDALHASGTIEQRYETGPRGLRVRFVRLIDPQLSSQKCGQKLVTAERNEPLSPLHKNGRTSEQKPRECAETNDSDQDKKIAARPTMTMTKGQPHIITTSAALEFPELPACLERRGRSRLSAVTRPSDG
jgi:predicted Fe-S protein YdhL (DUF1289 family)